VPVPVLPPPPDPPSLPKGPPVLELRLEGGKRTGELLALPAGDLKLGTAASNEVQLRERGIAFRHALLRVSADGRATLEDLTGKGGTRVQGEVLAPGRRWLLGPGDRVALGDVLELVVLEAPPADVVAAFEELVPAALCPPRARALVGLLAEARSLADARAARRADALELFDADVSGWVLDARRLLRPDLLPADPAAWVRHHEGEDAPLVVHLGADGARLLVRRWELVARIPPQPAPGAGDAARAAHVLPWLLAGAERLLPTKLEPLGDGWHRVDYVALRSDWPLLGRFERIEAVTDGRVVAADLVPTVAAISVFPLVAEDALEDSIRERQTQRFYRPASRGQAGNVPPVPMGGRYGRLRHKPKRGE
jgi:hypothetical protein